MLPLPGMQLTDITQLAFRSLKGNWLRGFLTLMIIAIGIMALVGILTAIDGIKGSISSNFSSMGANTFEIVKKGSGIQVGRGHGKRKKYPKITLDQALDFKARYHFPATSSIMATATMMAKVKGPKEETNPNIAVLGIEENYLKVNSQEIEFGRNFSNLEVDDGGNVTILGAALAKTLFGKTQNAQDKPVSINGKKYVVIGTVLSKGSSGIFNADNTVYIPITNARNHFPNPNRTYKMRVAVEDATQIESAISEATGTLRYVRGLRYDEENDFEFTTSDKLSEILSNN